MSDAAPIPCPLYARALRWRTYALSLWLGRMALAPFGLARIVEPLLALPLVVGAVGAVMGPIALWPLDRRGAALEVAAVGLSLVPAIGWAVVLYGPPPMHDATLPLGVSPGWLTVAGVAWLAAQARAGHRLRALHTTAWAPSAALLLADQPPVHRAIFAAAPRVAELLAPFALVLAIFAMARFEKTLRPARR